MKILLTILLLFSLGANAQKFLPYKTVVKEVVQAPEPEEPEPIVAKFNFSKTANAQTGWNNMVAGGSSVGNQSKTDSETGWTLITNSAQWELFVSSFWALNNGEGGSSAGAPSYTDFPAAVLAGGFIQSAHSHAVSNTTYPFEFTNLPAGTYEIKVISSIKASVNPDLPNGIWYFKFGSASATSQTIAQQANNTTNILTFTGTITEGQRIYFGPFTPTENTTDATIANALIITKTN